MDLNQERVYVRIPQRTFLDLHIFTPNEALMFMLENGIKLVDMTALHNILPQHVKNRNYSLVGDRVNGSL